MIWEIIDKITKLWIIILIFGSVAAVGFTINRLFSLFAEFLKNGSSQSVTDRVIDVVQIDNVIVLTLLAILLYFFIKNYFIIRVYLRNIIHKYVDKIDFGEREPIADSFLDHFAIDCIYAFTLSLLGGLLSYGFVSLQLNISLLLVVVYYMIEILLLFNSEVIDSALRSGKIEGFKSWHSWPTPGIFASSILLLIYFMVRDITFDYFSVAGLKKIWVIARYTITHPRLPGPNSKSDENLKKLAQLKFVFKAPENRTDIVPAKSIT